MVDYSLTTVMSELDCTCGAKLTTKAQYFHIYRISGHANTSVKSRTKEKKCRIINIELFLSICPNNVEHNKPWSAKAIN